MKNIKKPEGALTPSGRKNFEPSIIIIPSRLICCQ